MHKSLSYYLGFTLPLMIKYLCFVLSVWGKGDIFLLSILLCKCNCITFAYMYILCSTLIILVIICMVSSNSQTCFPSQFLHSLFCVWWQMDYCERIFMGRSNDVLALFDMILEFSMFSIWLWFQSIWDIYLHTNKDVFLDVIYMNCEVLIYYNQFFLSIFELCTKYLIVDQEASY
jgi:hypothetical protein